jgi:uncharacterized membrane protein
MPAAQHTVVIDRPLDEVFGFFTDPSNDPRWRQHVKEIAPEGPIAVGSRIRQVVQGPGGRGIPADIEVTGYESPTRYAFRTVAGPVRPVGEFRFAADGEGTSVSLSLSADLTGVKKVLMSRAVQRSMDSETHALDRAKAVLESS